MAALEPGDPVVVFAGYDDAAMDAFVGANPGLLRRVSRVFTFSPYTTVRARRGDLARNARALARALAASRSRASLSR